MAKQAEPDVEAGINYWSTQSADYDGVLGGFGTGSLPRIDALGSRQFALYLMPELCTVPSALRPLRSQPTDQRTRALDVGAGVGRVTCDVLLHLFSDVVLVEPVESFVLEAVARGRRSEQDVPAVAEDANADPIAPWKGIKEKTRSVTFIQGTLQSLEPSHPAASGKVLGRIGYQPTSSELSKNLSDPTAGDIDSGFDVIWCQWCLGHLTDPDLVLFLRRCRVALRDPTAAYIIVKENTCSDSPDGGPRSHLDEEDSSLTRSDMAFKQVFREAGLSIVHEQVQDGFPPGLYVVKMYALH
ncbi:DUF858-domain-containing protein [Gloeophyllum trabeum ATCC 11539]|uniref:Alpha N-terminal protein methyltransferase 1 n=1 Tax=Gloeophyllum trabeum (strain ATCC 11539 / FP-39264 / Madison 617) TaxID=670483 RepID=S7QE00_GLOTA|nr:DUF858-domain-containing protein [Gloeophyllum trabeum ATCC 11539]EPQ58021.1 DUF858-domain-containing protein [Gloeophyllum trabeum ATCC 11539]